MGLQEDSVLMALIEQEDTPTPPEKKQKRRSSNRVEEREDERPERALVYTSIVDLQQRTVHARDYGYGDTTPVHHYQKIGSCLGAGTYGKVYEGKHKETGERVALKMMKITQDQYDLSGVPLSVIREINILKQLKHENIVSLIETCATRDFDGVFIVMEYCDTDLAAILDAMSHSFMEQQSKCLILQLLRALAYIHEMRFLHRDIKTSNILLKQGGILKLADFGLARAFNSQVPATPRVVTLWYRSMELLLGSKTQTEGVDIWPVGCIMGELLLHQPLFPHDSEFKMISAISDLLGSPTAEIWPDYPNMPVCKDLNLNLNPHNLLAKRFEKHSLDAIDFMQRCFIYNPAKRMTAIQALEHPYFKAEPRACRPSLIPIIPRKASK